MTVTDRSAETPSGPPEAPPLVDTPERRDALVCPLCGYSLRGLSDVERPQCPECGYRFDWERLLRARQFAHPFLFEHHPRRKLTSFLWTFLAGFLPRRFWSSLNAGHEIHIGRLIAYAAVVAGTLLLTGAVGSFVAHAISLYRQNSGSIFFGGRWVLVRPTLDSLFFRRVLREALDDGSIEPFLLAAALAWPWLTLAALLVFQASMRRARIRRAHVVRVVVYCGDVFLWVGIAFGVLGLLRWFEILSRSRMWDDALADRQTAATFLFITLVATYRLGVAYRRYLRFDRPWASVLAAQVMVLLFITIVLVWGYKDFWQIIPGWLT